MPRLKSYLARVRTLALEHKIIALLVIIILFIFMSDGIFLIADSFKKHDDSTGVSIQPTSNDDQVSTPFPQATIQTDPTSAPIATSKPSPTSLPSPTPTASPTPSPSSSANPQPDVSKTSLNINPSTVPADGTSKSTIIVDLNDSNNNPISGQAITLTTSDSKAVFAPSSTGSNVTNSSGHATFTMTSTNTGTDSITVVSTTSAGNSTTLSNLGNVVFTVASPSP